MHLTAAIALLTEDLIVEDPDRVTNAYDAVTLTRAEIDMVELDSWDSEIVGDGMREAYTLVIQASSTQILEALRFM